MSKTTYPRQQDGSDLCTALIADNPNADACGHPLREHAFKGEQKCLRCHACPGASPKLAYDYQSQGRECPECGGKSTFVRWGMHVRSDDEHDYDGWRCSGCGHEWTPVVTAAQP